MAWVCCMLWIESAGDIYVNKKNHVHFKKDALIIVSEHVSLLILLTSIDEDNLSNECNSFRRQDGIICSCSSWRVSFIWAVSIWSLLAPLPDGSLQGEIFSNDEKLSGRLNIVSVSLAIYGKCDFPITAYF